MNKKIQKTNKTGPQKEPSRVGKSQDDIFSPGKPAQEKKFMVEHPEESTKTEKMEQEEPKEKQSRGRPIEHKEEWSKITVVLLDKQIHWLDQLASTIRLNTKAAVSRAELIRAVITAIAESKVDLSHLRSETDIKNFLLEKMKK